MKLLSKNWLLIVIIIGGLSLRIYQITLDKEAHVDSLSTLAKVNLTYKEARKLFRRDSVISISSEELKQKVLVNSHGIDFSLLNKDLKSSNHPPLYYYLYHIVKVISDGGSASLLSGQVFNLVVWLLCALMLFKLANLIFDNYFVSCFTIFIYSISANLANSLLLLKAYPLQELFFLVIVYVIIVQWRKTSIKFSDYLAFSFLTYCFLLLHYYSYIHLAFISLLIFLIYILIKKDIKRIITYGVSTLFSIGMAVLTYPRILADIKTDSRSTEIQDRIAGVDLIDQLLPSGNLLLNTLGIPVVILTIIFGVYSLLRSERSKSQISFFNILIALFAIDVLLIFMLSPYNSIRYVAPILPIVYIGIAFVFIPFIKKKVIMALAVIVIVSFMIPTHFEFDKAKGAEEKLTLKTAFAGQDLMVVYQNRASSLRELIYSIECENYVFVRSDLDFEKRARDFKTILIDQKIDPSDSDSIYSSLDRLGLAYIRDVKDFSVYQMPQ